MIRKLLRSTLATAAVLAGGWLAGPVALAQTPQPSAAPAPEPAVAPAPMAAEGTVGDVAGYGDYGGQMCRPWQYGNPDLFYNFYVPNNCGGVPAQMYLAPRPVPPLVGHTYFTYQPLLPHEYMYPHYRTYRHYDDEGRSMTRTKVLWYWNPLTVALQDIRQTIKIPR